MIAVAEIIGMFSFRWWQLQSGKVSYDQGTHNQTAFSVQERVGKYVSILASYAGRMHHIHVAPRVHVVLQAVVHYLAERFGAIHKKLIRAKRSLEGRNEVMSHGEASPFLKNIAEYKLNSSEKKENSRDR